MATGSLCLMVIGGRALNPGPCHRFLDPYSVRDEGFDFYYQEETKAPRPTTSRCLTTVLAEAEGNC
jgi:hypothetical protein